MAENVSEHGGNQKKACKKSILILTMHHALATCLLPVLHEDQVEEIANIRLGHCDVVIGFV